MTLADQLHWPGLLVFCGLAILMLSVSAAVGWLLLRGADRGPRPIETAALAVPWGVVFVVSMIAAAKSGGSSVLTRFRVLADEATAAFPERSPRLTITSVRERET